MRFASASIRWRALKVMLMGNTKSALQEMYVLLRHHSYPARFLLRSLLEPLFAGTLRKGGLFEIRSLRAGKVAPTAAAGVASVRVAPAASAAIPVAATAVPLPQTRSKTGPGKRARVSHQVRPPPLHPPSFRYLQLDVQGHELHADLLESLPICTSPVSAIADDVLALEPDVAEHFCVLSELPSCPAGRLLASDSKNNSPCDALWKTLSAAMPDLLFQFTVSLTHRIVQHDLNLVLDALRAKAVHFFFVVPNRKLFEEMKLQPYKVRNRCPHGTTAECQACALEDTRVEQFVLLCEIPGWEDYSYDQLRDDVLVYCLLYTSDAADE